MKRPLLSLFTLVLIALTACSGQMDAGDGNIKTPTSAKAQATTQSRSPLDEIVVDPLLPELVSQGVCVIYVFIPDLDWVDGEKETKIEAEVSRNLRNLGTTSARCMGGWPYVVIIHDSGAQLLHPCNTPDPASGGYAALVVPGHPKGACS